MSRVDVVSQDLTLDEYRELAEFRYQIRHFESASERRGHEPGVDTDCYLLLLAVQGLPEGLRPTVEGLAARLCVSREEVNRQVDGAVSQNAITRSSADESGAGDWLKLTRTGRDMLRRTAIANRDELERTGPELVRALTAVLKQRRRKVRGAA